MKYSYEYKRMCVEMYREGKWPETPEGIQERNFHKIIRKWFRMEESCGVAGLYHPMVIIFSFDLISRNESCASIVEV